MDDNEFDELLNRALRSYAAAEPLDGLPERVMTRVFSGPRRGATKIWALWAATMTVVVVVAVSLGNRQKTTDVTAGPALQAVSQPRESLPPPSGARTSRHRHRVLKPRVEPPRLSDEELALVHFVEADPKTAEGAFASLHEYMNRELTVAPIEVKPIQVEGIQ